MHKTTNFWYLLSVILLLIKLAACTVTPISKPVEKVPPVQEKPVHPAQPHSAPVIQPQPVIRKKILPIPDSSGYLERGSAKWYQVTEHGAKTASGEIYDLYDMSAGHATLPLLSRVQVTNIRTGRSVIVTINDRISDSNALIKLSYHAARQLGLVNNNTLVEVRGLPPPRASQQSRQSYFGNQNRSNNALSSSTKQFIQVGAFGELSNAQQLRNRLDYLFNYPIVIQYQAPLYLVRIGPVTDRYEINRIRTRLQQQGIDEVLVVQ